MSTKAWAVALVVFCTLLTSTAQLFYKTGANKLPLIFFNWPIIIGLCLYALGAILLIIALKGGELTILYPIIALGYIWVTLLSSAFFNEMITGYKIIGIALIVLGISAIGIASRRKEK